MSRFLLIGRVPPVKNSGNLVVGFLFTALLFAALLLLPALTVLFDNLTLSGRFGEPRQRLFQFCRGALDNRPLLFDGCQQLVLKLSQVGEVRAMRNHLCGLGAAPHLVYHFFPRRDLTRTAARDLRLATREFFLRLR